MTTSPTRPAASPTTGAPARAQTVETPDGPFTVIESAGCVVLAAGWTGDVAQVAERARLPRGSVRARGAESAIAVLRFYEGDPAALSDVPVGLGGTAFQLAVWRRLREIPPGSTLTYAELARDLGRPTAARAVAGACARNPVALFVPCHRVIASDGSPAGFAWGIAIKTSLLAREGRTVRRRTPVSESALKAVREHSDDHPDAAADDDPDRHPGKFIVDQSPAQVSGGDIRRRPDDRRHPVKHENAANAHLPEARGHKQPDTHHRDEAGS